MKEIFNNQLRKSGDSVFSIEKIEIITKKIYFLPVSSINNIRREILEFAETGMQETHPYIRREKSDAVTEYFEDSIDFRGNTVNKLSRKFYHKRGVKNISDGVEISGAKKDTVLMTCKYCIKYELNLCPKEKNVKKTYAEPIFLKNEYGKFQLKFDCSKCEMQVIKT